MYSPAIIDQRIAAIESAESIKLIRYDNVAEMVSHLDALAPKNGAMPRPLNKAEQNFIRNELLLAMCDFHHFATNYARIQLDGGGFGPPVLWASQQRIMHYIAKAEVESWEARRKGWKPSGIRILNHKARQLGATSLARCLSMHRMIFSRHINCMAASIDDDKVKELYDRDKRIYDNLPWWMRPALLFDEKSAHIQFGELDTTLLYQQSQQKSGLGQGRQFVVSHLTEVASWSNPQIIALDFIPTIPQSVQTLVILESTAQGRGNWWHEYTEETRRGEHPEWTYVFIPWYIESSKYRTHPPDDWRPSQISLAHAAKVRETSPEWAGRTVDLDRDQLYWYELGRASAQKAGELNIFLTNFCATPEESFQHTTVASFSPELLDKLRLSACPPKFYFEPSQLNEPVEARQ